MGLKEQGVRISQLTYTKEIIDKVAPTVLKEVNYLQDLILKGTIVVPDSEDALKAFTVKGVKLPK